MGVEARPSAEVKAFEVRVHPGGFETLHDLGGLGGASLGLNGWRQRAAARARGVARRGHETLKLRNARGCEALPRAALE